MNFEKKEEFIYFGRKHFCRKVDIHIIIIRVICPFYLTVKFTCIISCISGHLIEPLLFGDVPEDSLPITSWISKTFLQLKGIHLKKLEGSWFPIGDFRHLRYQFSRFLNFLTLCKTTTFC